MHPTQEEKYKAFRQLPEELQDAITSAASVEINQTIGREYTLPPEKVALLAQEIGLVLLGFSPPSGFPKKLQERLGIIEEQAKKIASAVEQETFAPVAGPLKKIYGHTNQNSAPPLSGASVEAPTSLWSVIARKRSDEGGIFATMKQRREIEE